jgi:two-component system nitrogen regulation response regulator NtrX
MHGKVLIVEDYADWRDLLSVMLQREGLDVAAAGSLQEAQAILEMSKDLDLAILDIRLVETDETNQDGMRLLSEIRRKHKFTRVIMITGHGTMELQRKAFREYKAFDFFRKERSIRLISVRALKRRSGRRPATVQLKDNGQPDGYQPKYTSA